MNTQFKIAFGIVAVLAGAVFPGLALPQAQKPHAPGTLILKDQLVFAGYNTPEATLESAFWAIVNGNYDAAIASAPKESATQVYGRNPAQFKKQWQSGEFQDIASLQIIARKNLSADRVELEFQMLSASQTDEQSEPGIFTMIKVGSEWKFDFRTVHDPPANWDSGGDVVVFVHREKTAADKNSLAATGILIPRTRLANVGYGTPEDALETEKWAWANTNYDKMLESVSPEIRQNWKSAGNGRERFEAGINKGVSSFEKIYILAKKKIADDRVELKLATERKQGNSTFAIASIQVMIKAGDGWKVGAERNYYPEWDKSSQPESAVRR
ncbi:MAG TPA: hypothetical protein VFY06_09540 [Verrucomicrobiae bacterium]|nr:hypothetical protein [Verrucomicrobiae bacterium]